MSTGATSIITDLLKEMSKNDLSMHDCLRFISLSTNITKKCMAKAMAMILNKWWSSTKIYTKDGYKLLTALVSGRVNGANSITSSASGTERRRQIVLDYAAPTQSNVVAVSYLRMERQWTLLKYYGAWEYINRNKSYLLPSSLTDESTSSVSSSTDVDKAFITQTAASDDSQSSSSYVAKVAFMITKTMKFDLQHKYGYPTDIIKKLKPANVGIILQNKIAFDDYNSAKIDALVNEYEEKRRQQQKHQHKSKSKRENSGDDAAAATTKVVSDDSINIATTSSLHSGTGNDPTMMLPTLIPTEEPSSASNIESQDNTNAAVDSSNKTSPLKNSSYVATSTSISSDVQQRHDSDDAENGIQRSRNIIAKKNDQNSTPEKLDEDDDAGTNDGTVWYQVIGTTNMAETVRGLYLQRKDAEFSRATYQELDENERRRQDKTSQHDDNEAVEYTIRLIVKK